MVGRRSLASTILVSVLAFAACQHALTVKQEVPLKDLSAIPPSKRAYESIMVLPPKGSERGEASVLAVLERALLRRGVRVISSGITGRVVVEETEKGRGTEGATQLSDLERALVLAKKSNATGLLQVGELGWVDSARYFVPAPGGGLNEAKSREEFLAADEMRRFALVSPRLVIAGKLIDVETGEIVASIEISRSVGDASVPAEYKVSAREFHADSSVVRERITTELMDKLATLVASGEKAPPKAAPPPEPAPSASAAPPPSKAPDVPKKKR